MSSSNFEEIDPSLGEIETASVLDQARIEEFRRQYARHNYVFFNDLSANDVVRVDLPQVSIDGISIADERTIIGSIDEKFRAVEITEDTSDGPENLVGQLAVFGSWGNLGITSRGGYFPVLLSHELAFGYHILRQGRQSAHNTGAPYSLLKINDTLLFDEAVDLD